ncbi:hypothetical protein A4D02_04470 [Niastella koreensis]|uniref:Transmembrane protein n=2 Tax=Niastella koreensis TaxID=354356 RepID=G8TRT7_NIAKG|nr:hypothetical protein [Niastella koreensis]AEW03272.1 hypothetical protein Niako_7051 [Niastella koreensis GR20-10]OQP55564.1 hypothetical protein A4D02_04470 [Niastella koreensis]
MQETVLSTLIYKYNPYARFLVVLYIVSMLVLCLFICDIIPLYIMWTALCIWAIPLVYAGISKKTVFNFRCIDSRLLTLSPSAIKVGKERYPVKDTSIELHINAYDGFVYRIRKEGLLTPQTTHGNNNMLLFTYKGVTYDNEFHLSNYGSYTTLYKLVGQWQAAGVRITVKENFTREFVTRQYEKMNRPKRKY